ncbi:MAG: T9SS type A sorting domain-containing protein [Bacteroidota bacterium]|nr:T9SS type A sorting domain-containing protein [Bacteroidota bacterium]
MKTTIKYIFCRIVFINIILLGIQMNSFCQKWEWAVSEGGKGYNMAKSVCTDKNGNIYTIGLFTDTINIGNNIISNNNFEGFYIAKYNNAGKSIWAKSIGNYLNSIDKIITDNNNDIYIIGSFTYDTIVIGNFKLENINGSSIFIVKIKSDGNYLWAKNIECNINLWDFHSLYSKCIITDSKNNVYVFANSIDSTSFGNNVIYKPYNYFFLAKYNSEGNFIWSKAIEGNIFPEGITKDSKDNIYLTGFYDQEHNSLGLDTIFENNNTFLAKFDTSGNYLWAKNATIYKNSFNGWNYDDYGISVDTKDNIYIGSSFNDSISFGNIKITGNKNNNIFIAKFNSSGICISGTSIINAYSQNGVWTGGNENVLSLATDSKDNLYVCGHILANPSGYDTLYFGKNILINKSNGINTYLAKYNSSGEYNWSTCFNGKNDNWGEEIALDNNDNLIITGFYTDSLIIGTKLLNFSFTDNIYLAKYVIDSTNVCLVNAGYNKTICKGTPVTLTVAGDANTYNWSNGLGSGTSVTTIPSTTTTYYITGTKGTCIAIDSIVVAIDQTCTGLDELKVESEKLKIYPNPGSGEFLIEVEGMKDEMIDLSVMDMMGKVVESEKINVKSDGRIKFDLSGFESGVYFLNFTPDLSSKGDGSLQRIVKKVVLMK